MISAIERFSQVVDNYVKYRPSYPAQVMETLEKECGLVSGVTIADLGSGTGLFSKILLDKGCYVYGVEPSDSMREASIDYLKDYEQFKSIKATSEMTTLPDNSVDFVTSAQSFHWFDIKRSLQEFKRILKSKGWVILLWNIRDTVSDFMQEYEKLLLKFATDYKNVKIRKFDSNIIKDLFGSTHIHEKIFHHKQVFDYRGLQGRILSTSYTPKPDEENYQTMLVKLHDIFTKHQQKGKVDFLYKTTMYYFQLED